MRCRINRTIRFLIGLALLVLSVPFLMSKLDSNSVQTIIDEPSVDYLLLFSD